MTLLVTTITELANAFAGDQASHILIRQLLALRATYLVVLETYVQCNSLRRTQPLLTRITPTAIRAQGKGNHYQPFHKTELSQGKQLKTFSRSLHGTFKVDKPTISVLLHHVHPSSSLSRVVYGMKFSKFRPFHFGSYVSQPGPLSCVSVSQA